MANEKLIKALRCKTTNVNDCTMCAYHNECYGGMLEKIAADALEAADKLNAEIIKNVEHWRKQVAKLRAQMPKEGEWIDIDGTMFAECSVCGKRHYGCTTPYCDMCGAKMKGEQE